MQLLKKAPVVALFIAMISSLAFVSCSGDDKDGNSSIVGTWQASASYSDGYVEYMTIVFSSNGTFSAKYWDNEDADDFGYSSGTYTYDSELNVLTLYGVDEDGDRFTNHISCTISGKKMVWYSEDETLTFTKQ